MTDTLTPDIEAIRARAEAVFRQEPGCSIRQILAEDIPAFLSALDAAIERAEKAEALVYVPGLWKCAKCDFVLVQSTLNARDGTVTPRNEPGDKCPNCASPLWRVSWKAEAADRLETLEKFFDEKAALTVERDTLRAEVERLREVLWAAQSEYDQMIWGEYSEYLEAGNRVQQIIDAALKGNTNDEG